MTSIYSDDEAYESVRQLCDSAESLVGTLPELKDRITQAVSNEDLPDYDAIDLVLQDMRQWFDGLRADTATVKAKLRIP